MTRPAAPKLAKLLRLARLRLKGAMALDVTSLNVFALCRCLRHAGKIMVLVVIVLVGAIWYAVLVNSLIPGLQSDSAGVAAASALGLLLYTGLVVMVIWCYLATFLTDPGRVPPGWTPFGEEEAALRDLEAAEEQLVVQRVQHGGSAGAAGAAGASADLGRAYLERPRYCKKCQAWKPPRAHHCSMTGCCVLKMDHYCVWVLNCVGLLNYKYFVLFLGYTFLGCLASAGLLVRPCIDFFSFDGGAPMGRTILAFVCFVFSAAFSLALLGFLIMHLRLVAINHTTIEAYEKRPIRPWPYNYGRRGNFEEVFGRGGWRRLAPVRPPEERAALLGRYLDAGGAGARSWHGGAGAEQQLSLAGSGENDSEHTL